MPVETTDVIETREEGVVVLTLNRPDRINALSRPMTAYLGEALPRLAADRDVGCVVLTGAGRGFCAGGDVKAMNERNAGEPETFESRMHNLRAGMEASRWLHEMPKPTIAMINGAAAGAGLSMALACDLRTCAASARLTTAFAKVGYSGDYGGTYFLSKLVGTAKARELYYLADVIGAEDAGRLGIVNRVIADDKLKAETMELAKRLANGPRVALGYMKKTFNAAESHGLAECFDMEAMFQSRTGQTEDHKEAARAFVEKRAPVFKGR
ncbi:enoyl-CoA hydratase [Desertibaculum subflavum]|uniref:enoyl-CoA hydratase n=1 Tax=Desertibaculum subflavum TaxID=2268458 RepID=UPI000E66ECD8